MQHWNVKVVLSFHSFRRLHSSNRKSPRCSLSWAKSKDET